MGTGSVAHAAQTFTVTNLNDSGPGSLRDAFAQVAADTSDSAPGDSIVFASGVTGTLTLTSGELELSYKPVQIIGPGADKLTIHAAPNSRIFDLYGDPAKVTGLTLTGGAPQSGGPHNTEGGAIYSWNGLELDGDVITGNTGYAGAVHTYGGTEIVNNSTISRNAGTKWGGAFAFEASTGSYASVNNSTITGNSISDTNYSGDAIYTGVPLTVTGSTISGNTGVSYGGQLYGYGTSGTVTVQDSIVSGNGVDPDMRLVKGATGSASFSLIRNTTPVSSGNTISTDATDITGKDPLLGPLAMNGGPTPTMLPSTSSPVLDQGKSFGLTTDQRGSGRPFVLPTITSVPAGGDHADIGAVEVTTPIVSGLVPSTGGSGTTVTISGEGFTGATAVMFGSLPAASFHVLSDGAISAVAPVFNGPAVDVRVIGPLGESLVTAADKFTFTTLTPTVSRARAKLHGRTVATGVKLGCPANGPSCVASFKATTSYVVRKGKHKHKKPVTLAKRSLTLSSGQSRTLTLTLSKAMFKELKALGHLKITLVITIQDGSGTPVHVKRSFQIKAPKQHKKHKH